MGRTLVCAADDPGGRITDSQVQHLAGRDEVVERGHDLLDGSTKVPPMDIQLDLVSAFHPQALPIA